MRALPTEERARLLTTVFDLSFDIDRHLEALGRTDDAGGWHDQAHALERSLVRGLKCVRETFAEMRGPKTANARG